MNNALQKSDKRCRIVKALKGLLAFAGFSLGYSILLVFLCSCFSAIPNHPLMVFFDILIVGPLCAFWMAWPLVRTCVSRPLFVTSIAFVTVLFIAIAVPNFLTARRRSASTRILEDLRALDSACDQYSHEKRGTEQGAEGHPPSGVSSK